MPSSDSQYTRPLLWSQLWPESISPALGEALAKLAHPKSLRDGERLYAQGDTATALIGVVSGLIRQVRVGADGREALAGLLGPGSWFGEISLFDDGPRPFSADADGPTVVMMVPAAQLRSLLDAHPEWYRDFARVLCQKLRLSFEFIEDGYKPLRSRVAKRLLDLARGFGRHTDAGVHLTLKLSQQELADMLGASRQRVNQELRALETQGWIGMHQGYIAVHDPAALAVIANTATPPNSPTCPVGDRQA